MKTALKSGRWLGLLGFFLIYSLILNALYLDIWSSKGRSVEHFAESSPVWSASGIFVGDLAMKIHVDFAAAKLLLQFLRPSLLPKFIRVGIVFHKADGILKAIWRIRKHNADTQLLYYEALLGFFGNGGEINQAITWHCPKCDKYVDVPGGSLSAIQNSNRSTKRLTDVEIKGAALDGQPWTLIEAHLTQLTRRYIQLFPHYFHRLASEARLPNHYESICSYQSSSHRRPSKLLCLCGFIIATLGIVLLFKAVYKIELDPWLNEYVAVGGFFLALAIFVAGGLMVIWQLDPLLYQGGILK